MMLNRMISSGMISSGMISPHAASPGRNLEIAPDPRLEYCLRRAVLIGAMLVLAVPAARGQNLWFGAMPLWLLGMPLASWWALHRFRLPRARVAAAAGPGVRRRHAGRPQARRRVSDPRRRQGIPHAA